MYLLIKSCQKESNKAWTNLRRTQIIRAQSSETEYKQLDFVTECNLRLSVVRIENIKKLLKKKHEEAVQYKSKSNSEFRINSITNKFDKRCGEKVLRYKDLENSVSEIACGCFEYSVRYSLILKYQSDDSRCLCFVTLLSTGTFR